MRKIIKRTLCVLSATMCVLGTAATASADTEQRFYVTGTSFNKSGTLRCRSGKAGQGTSSNSAYISSGSRASSASYTSYAAPNYTYEMYATSGTSGLNVRGRFTP